MPIIVPDPPAVVPAYDATLENNINRKNTTLFIAANPLVVELIPRDKVKQPSGGSLWVDQPARPAQTFRLIPRDETTLPTFNDEGVERVYDLVLLGLWSATVEIRDYWRDSLGFMYEVLDVQTNAYEVKAAISRHGNK